MTALKVFTKPYQTIDHLYLKLKIIKAHQKSTFQGTGNNHLPGKQTH